MNTFAIIMFAFTVMLLLVALLLRKGETGWLRTFERVAYKDHDEYARYLGKSVALIAVAMLAAGLLSLVAGIIPGVILLVLGLVAAFVWIIKKFKDYTL